MSGNIPDLDEYDEVMDGAVIHGCTDYGHDATSAQLYNQDWRRRQGRQCKFPGCEVYITDRAEYCVEHRAAGRRAKRMVRRLLARNASRESVA